MLLLLQLIFFGGFFKDFLECLKHLTVVWESSMYHFFFITFDKTTESSQIGVVNIRVALSESFSEA
jgi:hypothetical protein